MAMTSTSITRVCPHCQTTYGYKEEHHCDKGPPSIPPDDPLVGAVLGDRYQVESFLSSGGMGVVYKARHTVLDKPLAIKLMREAQDPVAQQRFLLEAKAAVHIGHEHIVDINDYGVIEDGRPYLVMEFLQGQSLEAVIAKGPLPWTRAIRIAEQIARGLQAVHEKGILHRDLKPGNIFLLDRQRRDYVKILDFGIAKVMAGTRDSLTEGAPGGGNSALPNLRATTQGMVLGTPEYLSPEQASGEPIDARVDQYALGCILYEMLTGVVPFRGNGPMSTLMKHLTEKPVPPRKRRPDLNIPESVERICLKAMAQRKEDRYANMEELGIALLGEIEQTNSQISEVSVPGLPSGSFTGPHSQVPTGPNAPTQKGAIPSRVEDKQRRLIVILIATILGLVLALALILYLTLRPRTRAVAVPLFDAGTAAPQDLRPLDAAPAVEPEDTSPKGSSLKITFVNKTVASVTLTCTGGRPFLLKSGAETQRELGDGGRCTAAAPGFKSRDFDVAGLRKLPKKAKNRVLIQLAIDVGKAPAGKGGAKKK
ncbi:MAG: serine/threonine-protein kinase [Polyangia bacterium]